MTEREIFLSALEIEDLAARRAHVRTACDGDAALQAAVESLLTLNDSQSQYLQTPVVEQLAGESGSDGAPTILFGADSTQDDDPDPTESASHGPASMTKTPDDDRDDEILLGYLEPATKPDTIGRLSHYEILEVLGRGAFGTVLKAFDEKLHRAVAIKVLAPEMAATSPARKRFLREARASAAVRHEHVVAIHAVDEEPLPYLVMDYIPGQTLQQRLDEKGPLDVLTVVRFGRQIAEGLAAAHEQDLIHRDIKPGNILLESGVIERVKITDFGLARAADDASMTQSGLIAGTPMYMAPEQALGKKLDHRADLFSLGSVLYQMASGRPPFRAASTLAVLKRVTEDTPRPINEVIPETPQWLCDIISKLHAKNPDERYQTAQEVAEVLADCEAQLKASAKLQDFSKIPRVASTSSAGRWKWVAAAVLLLPVFGLALTEFTGVTQWHHRQRTGRGVQQIEGTATSRDEPKADVQVDPTPPRPIGFPFAAEDGQKTQRGWAAYLKRGVMEKNTLGMKFVLIPPGEFPMNATYRVQLTKPYYLGIHEVTVGQFGQFVKETGFVTEAERNGGGKSPHSDVSLRKAEYTWRNQEFGATDDHPVSNVTHDDIQKFCAWLSLKDKKAYRLPTEAEWEWASRAGTLRDDGAQEAIGWYLANSDEKTHPVGQRPANAFGVHDMFGNVHEFCLDWFHEHREQPNGLVIDPQGPVEGTRRLVRGGCFLRQPSDRHAAFPLGLAMPVAGFRVGYDAAEPPSPVALPKTDPVAATFTNGIGMEFVIVPKGKSWLGGSKDKLGDKEVEIPADFYLGKYEVTQEEWEKVMAENPSHFSRNGEGKDAVKNIPDEELQRLPVETVTWNECQDFVARLNQRVQETGWVYRLPTDVEWEYACRGGPMVNRAESAFDFMLDKPTNILPPQDSNIKDSGLARTCKVGSYAPNRLGHFDMHGNVCEFFHNPFRNSKGEYVMARGGTWNDSAITSKLSVFGVQYGSGEARAFNWGLRLARVPAGAASPNALSHLATSPFTDADVRRIAALPAKEQVEEVRKELKRRNPGFDGTLAPTIDNDVVIGLKVLTDEVVDIAPVRALKGLTSLDCSGTFRSKGKLTDLSPLKGMSLSRLNCADTQVAELTPLGGMPLTSFDCSRTQVSDLKPIKDMPLVELLCTLTKVRDLSPLKGMKLRELQAQSIPASDLTPLRDMPLTSLDLHRVEGVTDLRPLQGMPLEYLNLSHQTISDLSPLKGLTTLEQLVLHDMTMLSDLKPLEGLRLKELNLRRTGVTDLSPLKGMELTQIVLPPVKNITQGLNLLRDMKSLTTIGDLGHEMMLPATEFWQRYDKGEVGFAPFTDADVRRIAALPAKEQVEEVRKELKRRNPGFDGKFDYKIDESGVVTEFRIVTDEVTDIAPIRVFRALQVLECTGSWKDGPVGRLADLTPLQRMDLSALKHLNLIQTQTNDAGLECFKDCKQLRHLNLCQTKVTGSGLVHFKDCQDLTLLNLGGTQVTDKGLTHFKDCKNLSHVMVGGTKVTDAGLANFQGLPLTVLWISDSDITDLTPLQGMPLEEILLTPKSITKGLDILRDMKSLKTIGTAWNQSWPTAEFWERYDKGEFTK